MLEVIMKFCIFILIIFVFSFSLSFSQSTDILYLKNGSIIKGKILEIKFNESVKLELLDGSIMVFEQDKIDKIEIIQNPLKNETFKNREYKRPGTAIILSLLIFPGVGQFYNENLGKGFLFFGAGALGTGLMYYGYRELENTREHPNQYRRHNNESTGNVGAIIFFTTWVISSIDAYSSAKRINRNLSMDSKKDIRLSFSSNGMKLSYRF